MDPLFTEKKSNHTQANEVIQELAKPQQSPSTFDSEAKLLEKKFFSKALAQQYKIVKSDLKKRSNPRSLYEMGSIYFAKKIFSTAINYFEKTIQSDPGFIPAYYKLFVIYVVKNKFQIASDFYRRIVDLTNRDPIILHNYSLFKIGHFNADEKNLKEVLEYIKESIEKKPDYYEALNSYGFVLLNFNNNIKEAEEYFEKAIKLNPKFAYSLNNLGVCKLRLKKFDEAELFFEQAQKNSPHYPAPVENLASSNIQQKKFDKALKILQTALEKKVLIGNHWVHTIGALHIELKSFKEAIKWYEYLLSKEPKNELIFNNLGHCQRIVGELSQSETSFRAAVDIVRRKLKKKIIFDSRSLLAFYNLGRISIDKGQEKELFEISSEILKINPKDSFGTYLLGASYMRKGEFEDAANAFNKSLTLNPTIVEAYPDFSFILLSLFRDYKSAVKLLEGALKLNLMTPLILNNLVVAYIKNDQNRKAADTLRKIDSPDPTIIATRGLLAMRQDDLKKGDEYYSIAVSKFKPSLKNVATQIWLYEQALYWLRHNDIERSKNLLSQSKKIGKSYVWYEIQDLENKISKKEKNI